MVKNQRSSASSATRKKHAKKAAIAAGEVIENPPVPKQKKPKGKEKARLKAEPKKKVYIPPLRPRAIQPDPLDTLGITYSISSELLVVLRKLGKKDIVTKIRALEELQSDWIIKAKEANDSQLLEDIITVLPVWLHHIPGLFLHYSRRIRLLSGGLHTLLLALPGIKAQLFNLIRNFEEERQETVIGSWCLLTHDIEAQVSLTALPSWEGNFGPGVDPGTEGALLIRETAPALISFIRQTIFDPLGVYSAVNPTQPSVDTKPVKKGVKPQPRVQGPPETPPADEEPEAERKGRVRAGGLGSVKYILGINLLRLGASSREAIEEILSSSLLWTSLSCGEQPPSDDSECFGYEQPLVRRAAWSLLFSVLLERRGELDAFLSTLSVSILRSAWVERDVVVRTNMWQPLLKFITEYPQCWELDAHFRKDADGSESESETVSDPGLLPSVAYKDFLRFLELGCRGSPRQGYPVLVIVLSTIPHSVSLPCSNATTITSLSSESPLEDLFTSLWSAIDSRAFGMTDKAQTFSAFAHAFVDCLLLFSKRLRSSVHNIVSSLVGSNPETDRVDSEYPSGTVLHDFIRKQTTRFVDEIFQGRLQLDPPAATKPLSEVVIKLGEVDKDLSKTAWDCISDSYIRLLQATSQSIGARHLSYLKDLQSSAAGVLFEGSVKSLIHQTFNIVIGAISKDFDTLPENQTEYIKAGSSLKALLDVWGKDGLEDPESSIVRLRIPLGFNYPHRFHVQLLRTFMEERLPQVVRCGPPVVSTYLRLLSEQPANVYWHQALNVIVSFTAAEALGWLDKFNDTNVPRYLQPSQDFEGFVKEMITTVLEDGTSHLKQALSLLERSSTYWLVTKNFLQSLFRSLSESFVPVVQEILRIPSAPWAQIERHLTFFESILFRYLDDESLWNVYQSLMPEVFLLGSLTNEGDEDSSSISLICLNIWSRFLAWSPENLLVVVKPTLRARLQFHVESVLSRSRPITVFEATSRLSGVMSLGIMDLMPSREQIDSMLSVFPIEPADASISLRSPLLPLSGLEGQPLVAEENYDLDGYSSYARIISLLLDAFLGDRIVAKAHPWALRHFLALSIYAEEVVDLPNSSSEVFDAKTVSSSALQQLIHKVRRVTTYVLSNVGDGQAWHQKVTAECVSAGMQHDLCEIANFVTNLLRADPSNDNPRDARILHTILQHTLSHTSKEEGDLWMGVCRKIETKAPFASMAVALSVAGSGSEPSRLDRYRNELAANAMGVRPTKINTEGLWIFRRLVVTAPDPDSDTVFIPQTRAVNLVKACQQWVASDEDIEEEVESQMTVLFFHLAPILQHVPGSHWDFIFDVVENNLENFAVEEPSTIVTLARSLQTILKIIDLATTNRALRANWERRKDKVFTLVRDIATTESSVQSGPLSTCHELLLTVAQNLPQSLIEIDTLGKVRRLFRVTFLQATHLLKDKSVEVQKMAYQFLGRSAKKRTEYIVIETGASAPDSDSIKPELPSELIAFLQQSIGEEDPDAPPTFGHLLGWMSVFDLFVDASLKVKIAYINHLRDLEMITSHFLPAAFRMFDLYSGTTNAPKLDVWGIDEYYVSYYEEENPLSVVLLCAHLYYRALQTVPTLVRLWISECKDRKLSAAVTSYTSKYFSSVLIDAELERVTTTRLSDEKMEVKVIPVHREVNTTYTIDENEIKMSLKIPADWPLHVIEVRGIKKVGVKEDRWKSWISGVRQVVLTQVGLIIGVPQRFHISCILQGNVRDGLELFKKNVSAHFENQTECAICYSLISATDGNLPNKPCQTCKNSFHASCLYEWFKSSHSSSCPLCRSNIIR
ncbi:hypothetical protein BDM02DRAFT_3088924 [Thelephora ganbajun]|uniref:Uncharacterized protein n=1 Tax=Thelephora ganbajun TaxID=370292 RepID=A0ACB6ZSE4_THEGA|nr:hypothetical protein BDM02DRAFT_3088924 [Thelephora ganbajun]